MTNGLALKQIQGHFTSGIIYICIFTFDRWNYVTPLNHKIRRFTLGELHSITPLLLNQILSKCQCSQLGCFFCLDCLDMRHQYRSMRMLHELTMSPVHCWDYWVLSLEMWSSAVLRCCQESLTCNMATTGYLTMKVTQFSSNKWFLFIWCVHYTIYIFEYCSIALTWLMLFCFTKSQSSWRL